MRRRRWVAGAVLSLLVVGLGAFPGSEAAAQGRGEYLTSGDLNGISCISMRVCTAVGDNGGNVSEPLAARWDGSRWSAQAVPIPPGRSGVFNAVSCAARDRCMAVGSSGPSNGNNWQAVAYWWNGTGWSLRRVPIPRGSWQSELLGVSCKPSTSCEAVGDWVSQTGNSLTLAERWNGHRWSMQKAPGAGLAGVSCPTTRSCFAVGPSPEHWNGRRWALQHVPRYLNQLDAVSCSSARACMAVGVYGVNERWNGKRWRSYPGQSYGWSWFGVSCPSRTGCTGVGDILIDSGYTAPAAEQLYGHRASVRSPGDRLGGELLKSVYCASRRACIAVGDYDLVSIWNGRRWSFTNP